MVQNGGFNTFRRPEGDTGTPPVAPGYFYLPETHHLGALSANSLSPSADDAAHWPVPWSLEMVRRACLSRNRAAHAGNGSSPGSITSGPGSTGSCGGSGEMPGGSSSGSGSGDGNFGSGSFRGSLEINSSPTPRENLARRHSPYFFAGAFLVSVP